MGKKKRIITSFSDVITNSSTEVFLIQGPDALRQMIGTGIYKKYQKDFLVLKTEEDVEYFFRFQGKKGFNHNYSIWDLKPLLGNLFNLYLDMNNEFPDKEDDIWEMFKPKIQVKLSLPNELLNLFGGNPEENIYAVDHIICLRFEIKQPILKQLTLSKVCKSIIDIVALTPEEFKSNAGTISRRLRLLTFNQIITTKEYINKATFIRNLGIKVTLSEELLYIIKNYEQKTFNH